MSFLDDILGFTAEKFRNQNEQTQKAFDQVRKTGKLPKGFLSGASGGMGAIAGQITPEIWQGMDAGTKGVMRAFFDKFPDVEKAVQAIKTPLVPKVVAREAMPGEGILGSVAKKRDMLGDLSDEMHLLKSPRLPGFNPSDETLVHELQHHINEPRVAATDPADAGTIGTLLKDILSEHGADFGSLDQRTQQLARRGGLGADPTVSNFLKSQNAPWAKLSPEVKANATFMNAPFTDIPGAVSDPYKGNAIGNMSDFLQRIMMDEGLAHLSQATVTGANPKLVDLAQKLNVGTRTPSASPFLDDVLSSMKQLQGGQ